VPNPSPLRLQGPRFNVPESSSILRSSTSLSASPTSPAPGDEPRECPCASPFLPLPLPPPLPLAPPSLHVSLSSPSSPPAPLCPAPGVTAVPRDSHPQERPGPLLGAERRSVWGAGNDPGLPPRLPPLPSPPLLPGSAPWRCECQGGLCREL